MFSIESLHVSIILHVLKATKSQIISTIIILYGFSELLHTQERNFNKFTVVFISAVKSYYRYFPSFCPVLKNILFKKWFINKTPNDLIQINRLFGILLPFRKLVKDMFRTKPYQKCSNSELLKLNTKYQLWMPYKICSIVHTKCVYKLHSFEIGTKIQNWLHCKKRS